MGYISAKENISKAATMVVRKAQKILQSKGVEIKEDVMQEDRNKIVEIGSKYFNIMYWTVTQTAPADGKYVGKLNYFYLFIAKRSKHNGRKQNNERLPILYFIPRTPKKEEC